MHEQNNAQLVTKMQFFYFFLCGLPKAFIYYFLVEAGWLPKHIKGYLSIRFFWKFRERDYFFRTGL
jgi:hypothetical protein